jgi:hypothetical protein
MVAAGIALTIQETTIRAVSSIGSQPFYNRIQISIIYTSRLAGTAFRGMNWNRNWYIAALIRAGSARRQS